uniref:Uncharacterized protein n=1 Tax=Fagus sylvatica TaxID=28930 RepID=A0A2N9G4K4_FAGSY
MEVAGAAVGAVLGPICNLLCGCVSSKMTTTLNLPSNLDVLVKDMKSLVDRRVYVKNEKEAAEKKGNVIRFYVASGISRTKISSMEVAGAAVGAVLGPICKLLCGCVSSKMTTALNLPSNLDVLVNADEKPCGS